jgi:uncharacterized membrane protein YeaQ/YmgE (transglycosylase-associated protein family)
MLVFILLLVVWGFVVGALARFALPGPDPMRWWETVLLGLAGSFIGGIIGRVLFGGAGGFLLALVGAVLLLALHRKYIQKRPAFSARRR